MLMIYDSCRLGKISKSKASLKAISKLFVCQSGWKRRQQVPSDTDMLTMLHTMSEWCLRKN